MNGTNARHAALKRRTPTARPLSRRTLWLGLFGGLLAQFGRRKTPRITGTELKRHEFPTSTQRMGVHFAERIRDTFRFRWIRRAS
jgi:hypothetical protein